MTNSDLWIEIVKLPKDVIVELSRDLRDLLHELELCDELTRSADEAFLMLDELESEGETA